MTVSLKPIAHQILVVTGASGGIGLALAREAAARGARLVLAARNGDALARIASELGARGARVVTVEADVSEPEEARRVAQVAQAAFGGFDAWISTAPTVTAGDALVASAADQRHLFDTLYWSAAHGAIEAARHLRRRGGAIVIVGGAFADRALTRHAPYGAARGAIEAFAGGLRRELEAQGAPVSLTLVKPSAVDLGAAAADEDEEGPAYDPAVVARAALFAVEHRRRTLVVGAGGFAAGALGEIAPGLARRMGQAAPRRETSYALEAQIHPVVAAAIAAGAGLAVAGLAYALSGRGRGPDAAAPQDARYAAWRASRPMRARRAARHPHMREGPRAVTR